MANLPIKPSRASSPIDAEVVKKKPTQPWRPAHHLTLDDKFLSLLKSKGLVPRWVRADDENLEKKKAEGWVFVNTSGNPIVDTTIIDGSKQDSTVRKRNLVLMAMPEDMVKSRREYHRNLVQQSVPSRVDEFKNATQGASYGRVEVSGGDPASNDEI